MNLSMDQVLELLGAELRSKGEVQPSKDGWAIDSLQSTYSYGIGWLALKHECGIEHRLRIRVEVP